MQHSIPFARASRPGFPWLTIEVREGFPSVFFRLLQTGVLLEAEVGCNIRALLCGQLGLDETYVSRRITTIFLDGKPVDDIDSAIVHDGTILSLSAAMPGLVGAAMRRGSLLASLRSSIIDNKGDLCVRHKEGVIRLKLFNMVMHELGPEYLKRGVTVETSELVCFLTEQPETFWRGVSAATLNGALAERDVLTDGTLVASSHWTMLSVVSRSLEHCP